MIDTDVAALLESGCSTVACTVDDAGAPDATRVWGISVLEDRCHVRAVLGADEPSVLANLLRTQVIAITATRVVTLESIQLKGRAVAIEPESDDDRARRERFTRELFSEIHEADGHPVELLERLVPSVGVAVVVRADAVYDQTPGPGAGREIARLDR